jgi:2-polyprenyl-3-methyl-5-hydroxy-6-metoxy-1,4-benzoquinol methylase
MKRRKYRKHRRWLDLLLKIRIPFFSRRVQERIYDRSFYEEANEEKRKSSRKVAAVINSFLEFNSVLDIGCGCGLYLAEFQRLGKETLGCEASSDAIKMAPPDVTVFFCDVTRPILLNRRFDLVLSIEVAEHIRKSASGQLVRNCTAYGDTVVFTAAPRGQGGIGHINEQPYKFWTDLFAANHFRYRREFSEKIRSVMKKEKVVEWIARNLMVFTRKL